MYLEFFRMRKVIFIALYTVLLSASTELRATDNLNTIVFKKSSAGGKSGRDFYNLSGIYSKFDNGRDFVPAIFEENLPPDPIASNITIAQGGVGQTKIDPNDPNTFPQVFSYEVYQNPSHGALTKSGNRFLYKPSLGFVGNDSFIIKVSDNGLPSLFALKTIEVTVNPNTVPIVIAEDISIAQGKRSVTQVTYNDSDIGQSHFFSIVVQPLHGTATITQQGSLYYTSNEGFIGTDSVTVSVKDSSVPAGVGLKVIPITVLANSIPILSGSNLTAFPGENVSTVITYQDEDSGQRHTFSILTKPLHGIATLNQQGVLNYKSNLSFSGLDSVLVAVSDNAKPAGVGTKLITINVKHNEIPVVSAPDLISMFGAPATSQITYTDSDEGQSHTYGISLAPEHGVAVVNEQGLITYTPNSGYRGLDSVTVSVSDDFTPPGIGKKIVHINVVDNTAPTVIANDISIFQGNSGSTLIGFTDPDIGQNHSIQIFSQPSFGVASIDVNKNAVYQPNDRCSVAQDNFIVSVSDDANGVGKKTIAVLVTPNTKPTVSTINFSIQQNEMVSQQVQVTDPNSNEVFSYFIKQAPLHGIATISSSGLLTYTSLAVVPSETDSIEIAVRDNFGDCPSGEVQKTIAVTILPNRAPVLSVSDILVEQDSSSIKTVSATDLDIYQTLSYFISNDPSHGVVTLDSSGNLTYVPNTGYAGNDQFKVLVRDNGQPILSDEKIVNVVVAPLNFPPVPTASGFATLSGKSSSTTINSGDPDVSQVHTYEIISSPALGTASVNEMGQLSFTANQNVEGVEEIQVKVTDNGAFPRYGIVYVSVEVVKNLAPAPANVNLDMMAGSTKIFEINPNDPNSARFPQNHNYEVLNQPSSGTVSINENGEISYISSGVAGIVEFDISVIDDGTPPLSGSAHVTINVIANTAPVVLAKSLTTDMNVAIVAQVDFSDANSSTQEFTYAIVNAPGHGTASVNSTGVFNYQPEENYLGLDYVTVQVTDNGNPALSGTAIYTINIQDTGNIPPSLSSIAYYFESSTLPAHAKFNLKDLIDTDGFVKEVHIDFGDSSPVVVINKDDLGLNNGNAYLDRFEHFYRGYGDYQVKVTLIDNSSAVITETINVNVSANTAPVVNLAYSTTNGALPLNVAINTSASTDTDGSITNYSYKLIKENTDQEISSGNGVGLPIINHTISSEGTYRSIVCLVDNKKAQNCGEQRIYAGVFQPVYASKLSKASFTTSSRQGTATHTMTLDASTSIGFENIAIADYQWKITSLVSEKFGKKFEKFVQGVNPTITLPTSGYYEVELTVVDIKGNPGKSKTSVLVDGNSNNPELVVVKYDERSFGIRFETHGKLIKADDIFWDLGNGLKYKGSQVFVDYSTDDQFTVKAQALDVNGNRYNLTKLIDLESDLTAPDIIIGNILPNYKPNQNIVFNAAATTDVNGPLTFTWNFGDGSPAISGVGLSYATVSHAYEQKGHKVWELRVTNSQGISSLYSSEFNITSENALPIIYSSIVPRVGLSPLKILARVEATIPVLNVVWNFHQYNNGDISVGNNIEKIFYKPGSYIASAKVIDFDGNEYEQNLDVITVGDLNREPYILGETLSVPQNGVLTHKVEFDSVDEEEQIHSFDISQSPANGIASINQFGDLVYKPNQDFVGADTLKVRVSDNSSFPFSSEGTFVINVNGNSNTNPNVSDISFDYETNSFPRTIYYRLQGLSDDDGNVDHIVWNFGDGSEEVVVDINKVRKASDLRKINHIYPSEGSYVVTATTFDNQGGSTVKTRTVNLGENNIPIPIFTSVVSNNGPYELSLDASLSTDVDGVIEEYCWTVYTDNNDLYDECGADPTAIISTEEAGTHYVELYMYDDSNAVAYKEFTLEVGETSPELKVTPYVGLETVDNRLGNAPLLINWSASRSTAYNGKTVEKMYWDFSSLQFQEKNASGISQSFNYKVPGTHYTKLKVIDNLGENTYENQPVFVGPAPQLKADFVSSSVDGNSFGFDASMWSVGHIPNYYIWNFGDGTVGVGRFAGHYYNRSGNYNVQLTVMDLYGNISTKTQRILVGSNTKPLTAQLVRTSGDMKYAAINTPVTWNLKTNNIDGYSRWYFGDGSFAEGNTSFSVSKTHTYTEAGIYLVTVMVTDPNTGRSQVQYDFVTVLNQGNTFSNYISCGPRIGQVPITITCSETHNGGFSPATYNWALQGDNGIYSMSSNSTFSYTVTEPGHYFIEYFVRNAAGDVDYAGEIFDFTDSKNKKKKIIKNKLGKRSFKRKDFNYLRIMSNK